MPSKKQKAEVKATLEAMPVHPITLTFVSVLKPEFRKDASHPIEKVGDVVIADLKVRITNSITVERLKGFQYSEEFLKLAQMPNASFYESEKTFISTAKSEQPLEVSLGTLTDGVRLLSWMLNNAPKLYLSAVDQKLGGRIFDRNYSEIVGKLQAQDVTKAYVSKDASKYVKSDVKDIAAANSVAVLEDHASSPIRQMRNAVYSLPGIAEKVEKRKEAAAALRESKKLKQLK